MADGAGPATFSAGSEGRAVLARLGSLLPLARRRDACAARELANVSRGERGQFYDLRRRHTRLQCGEDIGGGRLARLLVCGFGTSVPACRSLEGFLVLIHNDDYTAIQLRSLRLSDSVTRMRKTMAQADSETRCLRCGRRLTASTGYGPKCAAKIRKAQLDEARADFTDDQQAKADELIRDGGIVAHPHKGVFMAVSSKGDATYLVHAAACNCSAGLKSKRPCYHQLAARVLGIACRRSLAKAA